MNERLFVRLPGDADFGPETTAPAATMRAFAVDRTLAGYVSQVMAYRETFAPGEEAIERVLPDGAVRLIFDLGDAPSTEAGLSARVRVAGASTSPVVLRLSGRMEGLSVALQPGAAAALLGLPAGELEGLAVPLADIWGADGRRLAQEIARAPNENRRATLVMDALRARALAADASKHRAAARAARLVGEAGGALSLRATADAIGLGERRLQQLFFEHVGVSFRSFTRLARMHACLRMLRPAGPVRWADLAAEAGFSDQSHLANEFRSLCGLSPSLFLRQRIAGTSKTAA
jgi:AraC-like DNA-binding protein